MNIPNFASRCHANRSAILLSAWNERAWTASATAPSLARKILLLCRIFGSLRRQYLPMLSITGESVASYGLFVESRCDAVVVAEARYVPNTQFLNIPFGSELIHSAA